MASQSGSRFIITHSIRGAALGLLDPTQSTRLLRDSTHRLSFASFDPLTAATASDRRRPSVDNQLHESNRVVIETTPRGESFWRFVPSAKRENGCVDEGNWPRVVEICGQLVECSLDQWEIYKLDPAYECLVRMPPHISAIYRVHPSSVHPSFPTPSYPPQQTMPNSPEDQALASINDSGRYLPIDGAYLCAACLYLIGCIVVPCWMVISGPKVVPHQDTRITNVIISIASKFALGLALWIVALRLRAQWAHVLVLGRRVQLRGLLAACRADGSLSRVRHIFTVPTVGIGCTAVLGAAVTLLMTLTSAGFKYIVVPGTSVREFLGPDFQAICNHSLVNASTGYNCLGSANGITVNTEWDYLNDVASGAGGNVVLTGGRTGTHSANVTLTSAPADLRLATDAPPPWAAIDVTCWDVELRLDLVGNGSSSSNIVYVNGKQLDQLSIAEMPSWSSQVNRYQQINDTGPYSNLSPWHMVLLARDLDDGSANIKGLSGGAVSYLGASFVDLHGYGPVLQGILGAAAYCNFSGSTGGNWPSGSWPFPTTKNVVAGTGPKNNTLDLSTVFLNYGPSWVYNPVSANSLPGGSVSYIANMTVEADRFSDFIAAYMRNQWALTTHTTIYIGGFVTNTSYAVKTQPQLYIQATLIVLLPITALALSVCCAGACMVTMLRLGAWYDCVDVAPWWLLKATGVVRPEGEGHHTSKPEFETWCKQIRAVYSVEATNSRSGHLTLESGGGGGMDGAEKQ